MRISISDLIDKYVVKNLRKIPGEKRFGNYRFLPLFFLAGAGLELLMIKLTAGPNRVNFCN